MRKHKVIATLSSAVLLSWIVAGFRLLADVETPVLDPTAINLYDFQFNYIFTYLFL